MVHVIAFPEISDILQGILSIKTLTSAISSEKESNYSRKFVDPAEVPDCGAIYIKIGVKLA